jgi:peptidoglycan-associated lipoprotein
MKSVKFLNLVVLGVVLALPLVGCKRNPNRITPIPAGQRVGPVKDPGAGAILRPDPGSRGTPMQDPEIGWAPTGTDQYQGWPEDRDFFEAQTVYFDFDSSVVKGSEQSKTGIVAAHLRANPSHAVKIEGHCDERGTEEYNRALGERRALAVRETLIADGVAPERILTISYGEDRPADPGHNEAAWRKNRRGEFLLLTPP